METIEQAQARVAVDLRLRGILRVREMRDTMNYVTQRMPWWFRLKRAISPFSPSPEIGVAQVAAEEIIWLRYQIAGLEAKLRKLSIEHP